MLINKLKIHCDKRSVCECRNDVIVSKLKSVISELIYEFINDICYIIFKSFRQTGIVFMDTTRINENRV